MRGRLMLAVYYDNVRGGSPRMRGRLNDLFWFESDVRWIPAHAG